MGLFADKFSASLKKAALTKPIEGVKYPTDLGGHGKGPGESAKRSIPPSSKGGLPTKRSKGNSAPSPSIVTPNQNVILNTDPQAAVVCPTPDQSLLEKLPDKELIESLCDHGSKFMAELAMIVARSRNGFIDPQIVSDLKTSQEKVGELRYRLKVATKFAAAKSKELESKSKEVEALAAELSESKLRTANEVKAAREEGYRAGRADKVPSPISKQALYIPDYSSEDELPLWPVMGRRYNAHRP